MKLKSAVPWKMDSGGRRGGVLLWKNDTEPLEDVRSREHRQWPARHPRELANQTPSRF